MRFLEPVVVGRRILLVLLLAIVVVRIGSEFSGRGAPFWQVDLGTLFREQSTFYAGRYPHEAVATTPANTRPVRSDYPPFSFPLMMPWLPPGLDFSATRVWFCLCQAAAAIVVFRFAWRCGAEGGAGLSWMLIAGIGAMTGLRADILFGNLALIVTAVLVVLHEAVERRSGAGAATAWAASMLKPQMGWLFALIFVQRRQWRGLLWAVAGLSALALISCFWTGVTPVQIAVSKYSDSLTTISSLRERNSLVSMLIAAGLPVTPVMFGCALAGVAVTWWTLRGPLRDAGALQQMAFVGVVNRVCAYHNYCDDLLLVFALLWTGRRAWVEGGRGDWAAFVALGSTVWVPTILLSTMAAKMVVLSCWIAVAAWIGRKVPAGTRIVPPCVMPA